MRECSLTIVQSCWIGSFKLETLFADLDDNRPHSCTAGLFPVRFLNLFELEGSPDRHRDFSGFQPFEEAFQVRREIL